MKYKILTQPNNKVRIDTQHGYESHKGYIHNEGRHLIAKILDQKTI